MSKVSKTSKVSKATTLQPSIKEENENQNPNEELKVEDEAPKEPEQPDYRVLFSERKIPMIFISSPFFRTVQTAAAFQFAWTKDAQTPIYLNPTIVGKTSKKQWQNTKGVAPFGKAGAVYSYDTLEL